VVSDLTNKITGQRTKISSLAQQVDEAWGKLAEYDEQLVEAQAQVSQFSDEHANHFGRHKIAVQRTKSAGPEAASAYQKIASAIKSLETPETVDVETLRETLNSGVFELIAVLQASSPNGQREDNGQAAPQEDAEDGDQQKDPNNMTYAQAAAQNRPVPPEIYRLDQEEDEYPPEMFAENLGAEDDVDLFDEQEQAILGKRKSPSISRGDPSGAASSSDFEDKSMLEIVTGVKQKAQKIEEMEKASKAGERAAPY
jgi:ABC-type transporter Mla subunit MlaD